MRGLVLRQARWLVKALVFERVSALFVVVARPLLGWKSVAVLVSFLAKVASTWL